MVTDLVAANDAVDASDHSGSLSDLASLSEKFGEMMQHIQDNFRSREQSSGIKRIPADWFWYLEWSAGLQGDANADGGYLSEVLGGRFAGKLHKWVKTTFTK